MSHFWLSLVPAALGPLQFGYHLAELNAPEGAIRCPSRSLASSLPECIPMSEADFGFVSSIFAVGGLVGALSISNVADKYGRKRTLLLTTIPFILGSLITTSSPTMGQMATGRFITGFAAGGAAVVAPLYVHEICTTEQAGKLGATTQIAVNTGILLTQTLGLFYSDPQHWRWILAFGILIAAAQLVSLLFIEESPKWLKSKGFPKAAARAEQRLHGGSDDLTGDDEVEAEEAADSEEQGLLRRNSNQNHENVNMWTFIRAPEFRRQLIVVVGIMAGQQLTGINAIILYGVSVLKGMLPQAATMINVGISAMNLIITASSAPLFERLGRKPCLMISISGMGLSSFLLGLGIVFNIAILSAIATIAFVASFSMGLGPLPWTVASEIVEFRAVGAAQSLALAANWSGTFLVAYMYPVLKGWVGAGPAFWVFTVVAAAFLTFVTWYVPETKGAGSPEEVWERWDERKRAKAPPSRAHTVRSHSRRD